MAITFSWKGYDGTGWNFNISTTNVIGFYGSGGYGSPIQVGNYNDATHIRTSTSDDTDACAAPHLTNLKYIASNQVSIAGGSPVALTSVVQTNCIRITVTSDTSIAVIATRLYAYDGTNVNNPPANVTFQAFSLTNTVWSSPGGRAAALSCGTNLVASTTANFYTGMSISPTSTGASTLFVTRFEADVQ